MVSEEGCGIVLRTPSQMTAELLGRRWTEPCSDERLLSPDSRLPMKTACGVSSPRTCAMRRLSDAPGPLATDSLGIWPPMFPPVWCTSSSSTSMAEIAPLLSRRLTSGFDCWRCCLPPLERRRRVPSPFMPSTSLWPLLVTLTQLDDALFEDDVLPNSESESESRSALPANLFTPATPKRALESGKPAPHMDFRRKTAPACSPELAPLKPPNQFRAPVVGTFSFSAAPASVSSSSSKAR